MTLVADDLLTPDGEIDGALFFPTLSSGELAIRLSSYLTQGYTLAPSASSGVQDHIARLYAYYRAWSDVVNMLTLTPASVSLAGEVASSRLQTQIDAWIAKRDSWQAQYLELIPLASNVSIVPSGTMNVPVRTSF
jgi:hypothetical protein